MATPLQNARWSNDAADAVLWGALQAASTLPAPVMSVPTPALDLAAAWPVVAGLTPVQAMEAVAVLRNSLAAGPTLDGAAHLIRAALEAPAAEVRLEAGPTEVGTVPTLLVQGGIDLVPFQAMLIEFRAAEQTLDGLPSVSALPEQTVDVPAAIPAAASTPTTPGFMVQGSTGTTRTEQGEATDGAVDYLQAQYIHAGNAGVSIGAAMANVFIKGGAGDDALAAQSGRNVLDGGRGSNFLVGGTGVDTYFIDGRGGQATWGTVVGFEAGEIITVWGFDPAVSGEPLGSTSRLRWAESEGAASYTGRTLHADMDGTGTAAVLVTIAGADAAAAGRWTVTTGSDGANAYLAIINMG